MVSFYKRSLNYQFILLILLSGIFCVQAHTTSTTFSPGFEKGNFSSFLPNDVTVADPTVTDDLICLGENALLTVTSNSGLPNPSFEWFDAPAAGNLVFVGDIFQPSPLATTTYYVQERVGGDRVWNFENDLQDWIATSECGLTDNWQWSNDGGAGSAYATNPTGESSSMLLK